MEAQGMILQSERIEELDYSRRDLSHGQWDDCSFHSCSFDEAALVSMQINDCVFERCTFILTDLAHATLNQVHFHECTIIGVHFEKTSELLFSVTFSGCLLDSITCSGRSFKGGRITDCTIRSSDLFRLDLSHVDFSHSSFQEVAFSACDLSYADFSSASGYSIDPENNRISHMRCSLPEAVSFLRFLDMDIV